MPDNIAGNSGLQLRQAKYVCGLASDRARSRVCVRRYFDVEACQSRDDQVTVLGLRSKSDRD